jgi:hypothetical protein
VRLTVPGRPGRLAVHKGRVLVSVFGREGGVAIVDPARRRIEGYLAVDPKFCVGSMAVAGDKLFVAQLFSDFLLIYDLRTRELLQKLPVGGEGALAASPDGRHVYFGSNKESAFAIIDAATYEYRKIAYPKIPSGIGRGCLVAKVAPDGAKLYLGIQRPTPFLAVYDLRENRYEKLVHLYEPEWEDDEGTKTGIVADLAFSDDGKLLFVAMFQSVRGIFVVDCTTHEIQSNITFESRHKTFRWADPIGLTTYGDKLVAVVRHRHELALLSPERKVVATVPLGGKHDGPTKVLVLGHTAIVSHGEHKALLFVNLREALRETGGGRG